MKIRGIYDDMAKKFIHVLKEDKANMLIDLGFKYREELKEINGEFKSVYIFMETDELHKILQDKTKFSKRDYYYDNTLRF